MRVASLHIYPIKGCHRLDRDSVSVLPWGVAGDRRWLIVDEFGDAVTQRENVALTRIFPKPIEGGLLLSAPGCSDLKVAEPTFGPRLAVSVFSFSGVAAAGGPEADAWLTEALGQPVRLAWLDDTSQRGVPAGYGEPGDRVAFQDEFPVTLGNLNSLAALNDHIAESGSLEGPLPMTRFRPNIVIADAPPWAEDGWNGGRVRIGEVVFRVPKGCGRCVVTTTDQETGERGHEPLRSLGTQRNVDQKLLFATNLISDGVGTVRVGDTVTPV
jgi:uncharacterized protein